jgi:polyhydroxyalkanoate synthesis regulator phasin
MPPTSSRRRATADSARSQDKDFVSRLADAGEEALQRLSELPGGNKALTAFNDLRARVDELGKKVRGIDELEARVAKLEKQVAELKPKRRTTTSRTTRKRSPPL